MAKLATAILLVGLATAPLAFAAPPPGADPNSPTAQFFQGLRQPHTGASCCSISDCRAYQARVADGHYEVWHDGAWLVVPDAVILPQMVNPIGETIACINGGRVLCLVRGPET